MKWYTEDCKLLSERGDILAGALQEFLGNGLSKNRDENPHLSVLLMGVLNLRMRGFSLQFLDNQPVKGLPKLKKSVMMT